MSTGVTRARPGWWLAMVLSLGAVVVFATLTGNWLGSMRQDTLLGNARVGEWLDMRAEDHLSIRIDEVTVAPELPSYYDENEPELAPNGLSFVRILLTVRLYGETDPPPVCYFELRNAVGEEITQESYSRIAGPESERCNPDDDAVVREIDGGIEFESQVVLLAAPAPASDFDVIVMPALDRYWVVDVA